MGEVMGLYLMPHPPIIMPDIGRGEERRAKKTVDALKFCAKEIKEKSPKTIVLISPHGPVFQDAIAIMKDSVLAGDMGRFGRPDIRLQFKNDTKLSKNIAKKAQERNIASLQIDKEIANSYSISTGLDWGALVPLYFVSSEYKDFKLVHITISFLDFSDIYRFGMAIADAVRDTGEDVVIIASGDLSHKLLEDGPYGFHPSGPKLDNAIIDHINRCDIEGLMNLDKELIEEGGECGLRSIIMGFGALDGKNLMSNVLSYEGPFGVGYGVASIEEISREENPYILLARKSLESYVKEGEIIDPPNNLPDELLDKRAGVFVTLKKSGALRGCIGTIAPTQDNIAKEIIQNAISAGTKDSRFAPVGEDELSKLVYSVDVLEEPEPIESIDELDVEKYGVIVQKGLRRGLLLPNIEGVDTPRQQVDIALGKAGIGKFESYSMERFRVVRHK